MAKIDLDSLNIEELAALRERVIEKLAEKVALRQTELAAEMERLTQQYGKPTRKSQGKSEGRSQETAAPAKAKKSEDATNVVEPRNEQAGGESVANAA